MTPRQPRYSPTERLTVAALFALAFAVRCLPFTSVLGPDGPRLLSTDAYYHLRRICYLLGSASTPLDFDPYVNFPGGAKPIWPWLFDQSLSWIARPFVGSGTPMEVAGALIWAPPLLGAACVASLFWLARRFLGFHPAWVAAFLLSLLPAHVHYSRLSVIDHHVAVALGSTLLLAAALECLQRCDPTVAPARKLRASLALGAAFGINLLIWPGTILHVGLIEVALLATLGLWDRGRASALASALLLSNLVALALVAPFSVLQEWPQWGPFSPVVLSRFQPWFFAGVAFTCAGCCVLWRFPARGRSKPARAAHTLAVGLSLLGLSALLLPDLRAALGDSWQWMSRDEAFQRSVSESKPLLYQSGQFTDRIAVGHFSYLAYAFPFAALALAWRGRAGKLASQHYLIAYFGLAFALTTLAQRRFQNTASVSFALIVGWGLVAAFQACSARLESRPLRTLVLLGVLAVSTLCMLPSLRAYTNLVANATRAARGEALQRTPADEFLDTHFEVARWFRDHTPATSGLYDASEKPEYSVLGPWALGHILKFVGERPTVVDNFGDDNGLEQFMLAQSFEAAGPKMGVALMQRFGARYLLLHRNQASARLSRKLFQSPESVTPGFRWVFESTSRPSLPEPEYRVFELVPGAQLRGRAAPGSEVTASLSYATGNGTTGTLVAHADVDAQGWYVLELPYATPGSSSSVRVGEAYRIDCGDRQATQIILESQVLEGATLEGPDLR